MKPKNIPMYTPLYPCIPMNPDYILVDHLLIPCIPLDTHAYLYITFHIMHALIYLCIAYYTPIYPCIPLYTLLALASPRRPSQCYNLFCRPNLKISANKFLAGLDLLVLTLASHGLSRPCRPFVFSLLLSNFGHTQTRRG